MPTPPVCCTGADDGFHCVQVRITTPGKTRNYISYATALLTVRQSEWWRAEPCSPAMASLDLLCLTCAATLCAQDKKHSSVSLKAMGQAINKTVTIGTRLSADVTVAPAGSAAVPRSPL